MQVLASIRTYPKENSQKGVDGGAVDLHNLVSLLLMQRRRTKRYRWLRRWATRCGFGSECGLDL
jgi:hypothetical protein